MFNTLTQHLHKVQKVIRGQARIRESNITDALRDVRMALLEADVSLPVVKHFIQKVKERALGQEVLGSLTPNQVFISIVHEELVALLGGSADALKLNTQPPACLLMAGLQGSGKTTTAAKLARHLQEQKKRVLLTSCDVYRPAAMDQLQQLAQKIGATYYASPDTQIPNEIAQRAREHAQHHGFDVLIVDTAGRTTLDEDMMAEIALLHRTLSPIETLFVCDAMLGQDAVATATAFQAHVPLTGIILTKLDGDARGGALLSIWHTLQKPIKFCGVSEKPDGLEAFDPARMASRILGMGDIVSLVEETKKTIEEKELATLTKKIQKGKQFDLTDFRQQILQLNSMGGVQSMMKKLPAHLGARTKSPDNIEQHLKEVQGIIDAMTPEERAYPDIIKASRKKRIAQGSGTTIQKINQLLNQFQDAQKFMKQFHRGAFSHLLGGLGKKS